MPRASQRSANVAYYTRNRALEIDRVRVRQHGTMDFDHRDPASKRSAVSRMVGRAGMATILEEVAKCDIVCANCHRLRTFERRSVDSARE